VIEYGLEAARRGAADPGNEETWILLPDGREASRREKPEDNPRNTVKEVG
jgi:hypothetical protein